VLEEEGLEEMFTVELAPSVPPTAAK